MHLAYKRRIQRNFMEFGKFKAVLFTCGINECNFHLKSTKQKGFVGFKNLNGQQKFIIVFDGKRHNYVDPFGVFKTKIFDGKNLEDIWNDVEIDTIDQMTLSEFLGNLDTSIFYLTEADAEFRQNGRVDVEQLVSNLKRSECDGDVFLYAGTKELSDFSANDEQYKYFIYAPFCDEMYLLEKVDNKISFEYVCDWKQRKHIKYKGTSKGRKHDIFSSKSAIGKSDKYKTVLKYYQNLHLDLQKKLFECILPIILVFGIVLRFQKDLMTINEWELIGIMLSIIAVLVGIIVWKTKEREKLSKKIFTPKSTIALPSAMFSRIQHEAEEEFFYNLYEKLALVDKDIDLDSGFLYNGKIETYISTKKCKFEIVFYSNFAQIHDMNVEEENIVLMYDDFNTYEDLELKIYEIVSSRITQ